MYYQMPGGQPPVVPQKPPTSSGIEISNVTEGETVYQVQEADVWLHYSTSN